MNEDDVKKFLEEYKALVDKYGIDFVHVPQYVPNNEKGTWELRIVPTPVSTKQPQPSPFVKDA